MAPQYRDDPGSNAPEVNHQEQHAYLYPATEESHAYGLPPTKSYNEAPPAEMRPTPAAARGGWKRWWILALIGLFIAVIAGLVGGFIGQSIEQALQKGRESSDTPPTASPSSAPSNGSSSATTPPANVPAGTIGTIVIPETGCNFPASKDRRRISNTTVYSKKQYTTICNSGWIASGIIGLWTLTPSDCVEACIRYNDYGSQVRGQRPCVGGGFIPSWTNQTLANLISNGPPFNCYLQANATGITINDRENSNVEVVALCLDGQCNGIGT